MTRSPSHDPDGLCLPIKLDSTSNGEFAPVPLAPIHQQANRLALEQASVHARYIGLKRREFLISACGAASTLLAFNAAHAAAGPRGGFFELDAEAALDPQLAAASVEGDEFIFDVQGHFVDPQGAWTQSVPSGTRPYSDFARNAGCEALQEPGLAYLDCLNSEQFVRDVFMDSDTDLMVLSFVPSRSDAEPLTIEEAAATAQIVEQLDGTHRLLLHGRVNPNQEEDLEAMDELVERWDICAWKTYTQ